MNVLDYLSFSFPMLAGIIVGFVLMVVLSKSFHNIGGNQVGLVLKSFGKSLPEGKLIAENGEAGYQVDLLMPGWRFKLWPLYKVSRHPWVQIREGHIGVVIAQVGAPLPAGAKSAVYSDALGDFTDVRRFLQNGGQRGVQRPVLSPGTTAPMHPMAFIVRTVGHTYGHSLSDETNEASNLPDEKLTVTQILPKGNTDMIGVVTTLEGPALPSGDIAGRIGGFADVAALEQSDGGANAPDVIQLLLGSKNNMHNNYQNYQAFLDAGGCIGLQHDVLVYGAYNLNPFLVNVQIVPMLVVDQGEVAVIKAYVGLPDIDTSGAEYKFGSIVAPGHRGLWTEPLRTGKYALNPRIYDHEKVPTSILTLNWATAVSEAHNLDSGLSPIVAKSREAFEFKIDLQVQIHVPDTKAPQVIGMVGTMQNLVNEVLQSAVGNYIRNALQKLGAIEFIEKRDEVQKNAEAYVTAYLVRYSVEVRGVYIQDVVFPADLTQVLTKREIATQERETYISEQAAQEARVALERQRGVADSQAELARAQVSIEVNKATAQAAVEKATGEATVIEKLGTAEGGRLKSIGDGEAAATRAKGLAEADAYDKQQGAIGREQTALVALMREIATGNVRITPDIMVGGSDAGGIGGLVTLLLTNAVANQVATRSDGAEAPVQEHTS